jgi:hypothetical protein
MSMNQLSLLQLALQHAILALELRETRRQRIGRSRLAASLLRKPIPGPEIPVSLEEGPARSSVR